MAKKQRHHSEEFKRSLVSQVVNQGKSCKRVAIDNGISPGLLHGWKMKLADSVRAAPEAPAKASDERANPVTGLTAFLAGVDRASKTTAEMTFASLATLAQAAPAYDAMLQRLYAALGRLTVENEMLKEQLTRK